MANEEIQDNISKAREYAAEKFKVNPESKKWNITTTYMSACEWKDQQFKEYLEKKQNELDGTRNKSNYELLDEIINELFTEDRIMENKIPFKHKELEEASHDKRFKSVWESVAFRLGVMWALTKIYTDKTSAEILEEIEAPIVTCD